MNENKYSVLMSVYFKEKPNQLKESIDSMIGQTVKPDEIVLVKDGPLTDELENVINEYKNNSILKIVELQENVGLGRALSIGLKNCKNEIIARMDSDDISNPKRCEEQMILLTNPAVSVVGTAVAEFVDDISNIVAYKNVIEDHRLISKKMKYKNPINHPTVMFKKKDVLAVGGYQDFYLNEDYFLWVRMLEKGYRFRNINIPLVYMRITNETYERRGGWNYFIVQKKLFDYMLSKKVIGKIEYIYNNLIRFVVRVVMPNKLRRFLYLNFLRKKVK